MRIRLLVTAFFLLCLSAFAQQPSNVTVLKAAQLYDSQRKTPVRDAVVIIEGNKIKEVGSELPIPKNATVIDLGDSLLLPGYIDCHTHLLQNYDPGLRGEDDAMLLTVAQMSTAKRALLGVKMGMEDLLAGITTVRDVGNSGVEGDVALRDAINDGWVKGPRIAAATRALSAPGGQFGTLTPAARSLVAEEYVEISSPDDARRAVQQAVYAHADVIKVIVNASATLTSDEMKAIVDEAHRHHRKVAAHAIGDLATRIAAEAGVDSIEHAYVISDDVLKMMAAKHIFLVPTDTTPDGFRDLFLPSRNQWVHDNAERIAREEAGHRGERLKRAVSFGVPVAAGSDMYYQLGSRTRGEGSILMLQSYLDAGMTPDQVVKFATSNAAELLGWQDRIGSLQQGKLADIIAVPADALQHGSALLKVRFVMKDGAVYRNDLASAQAVAK